MEYLFRGKRKDNNEWIEGFLYIHDPPLQCIVPKDYIPEKSTYYILKAGFADWNMPRPIEQHEIIPETIGMGITKGGTKFFDGDLYITEQLDENHPEKIDVWTKEDYGIGRVYVDPGSIFIIEDTDSNGYAWSWMDHNSVYSLEHLKKIGTIHDKERKIESSIS